MEKQNGFQIIIEEWPDAYTAYPIGVKGVVVAEGDTYEDALAEIRSAIQFHIETFGRDAFADADTT